MAVMASWSRLLTPENSHLQPIKAELTLVLTKRENHCLYPAMGMIANFSVKVMARYLLSVKDASCRYVKPANLFLIELLRRGLAQVLISGCQLTLFEMNSSLQEI